MNLCKMCGKYPATICVTCHNEGIDAETKPEKNPPDLKGYTRFRTSKGGVWIKNEPRKAGAALSFNKKDWRCLDCGESHDWGKKPGNHRNGKVQNKFVYAYDPIIKRRIVHLVKDGIAISMVTGHRFKMPKSK